MRIRILVLATAVLLFGAIMTIPRIIEASKSSAATANSTNPFQGRRSEITVGESIRNHVNCRPLRVADSLLASLGSSSASAIQRPSSSRSNSIVSVVVSRS